MRQNASKVIEGFKAGVAAVGDSKRTISTDGKTIFSYKMPIACRLPSGVIRVVSLSEAPSVTTKSQIRAIMAAFPDAVPVTLLSQ